MLERFILIGALAIGAAALAQEIQNPELRELDRQFRSVYGDPQFRFYYSSYFKKGFFGGFYYPARVDERAEWSELPQLVPTEALGKVDRNVPALRAWLSELETRARAMSENPTFSLDKHSVVLSHTEGSGHKFLLEGFVWDGGFRCPFLSYLDTETVSESRLFLPASHDARQENNLATLAEIQRRLSLLGISTTPPSPPKRPRGIRRPRPKG